MSDRPLIAPNLNKPVINAHSTAASFNGPATIIQRLPGISYDVSWDGTTTGTLKVQVSNTVSFNPDGSVNNAGNWHDLPSTAYQDTLPAPSGSPGNGFICVPSTQAYAARLVFTRSGGSGTLTAVVCAKVL